MENIKDRIDEIYKQNSKIPFMQSKDILQLGYEYALKDNQISKVNKDKNEVKNIIQQNNEITSTKNNYVVGTSKEIISYSKKLNNELEKNNNKHQEELKQQEKDIKTKLVKKHKLEIEKQKLEITTRLTGDILFYINTHHDIFSIMEYIKNINDEYRNKLYIFNLNNNCDN